jgi:hypothetical protein
MKPILSLATVGLASAHTPINEEHFLSKATPATYDVIGAIGEAYHNALCHCYRKTSDWMVHDLGLEETDPTYDNNYYVEYQIKNKIPEVYEIFNEILEDYWEVPTITSDDSMANGFRLKLGELSGHSHA